MYSTKFDDGLSDFLDNLKKQGLYKEERIIYWKQGAEIYLEFHGKAYKNVLNFCSNNYLGLAGGDELIDDAYRLLKLGGYGMSSVRFICGTNKMHKDAEEFISRFLGVEDTIIYTSCFDANGGLFECMLTKDDAIIPDSLNHASIIDGVRLCKAQRFIYKHSDMEDLEDKLKEANHCRYKIIATDGVFSMDGDIAKLKEICDLADKYEALVMVDDSHATGFLGNGGRGSIEHCGVMGRVDIITSTLGKALGGAVGGFTGGKKKIIEVLRQSSRPYLFSNTLPPAMAGMVTHIIDIVSKIEGNKLRRQLRENTAYFRNKIKALGFTIKGDIHPIIPIMLGDNSQLAQDMSIELLEEGILAIAFSYPVVPRGQDRIRVQISAAHTKAHLDFALEKFEKVGKKLKII